MAAERSRAVRGAGPSEPTDTALVEGCLKRDPRAWETLVRRYRRLVYSVPTRMGLRLELRDEVFQETFATLLEKLPSVRDRERIGIWLAVTARRKALDLVRRGPEARETGLSPHHEVEDGATPPVDELIRLERQAFVRARLEELPRRCQDLLLALYAEEPQPSYRDLAQRFGLPVGSLGPTRARCFEKLRKLVGSTRP